MKTDELKQIAEGLIETTDEAGKKSIELYKKGLKIITKSVLVEFLEGSSLNKNTQGTEEEV